MNNSSYSESLMLGAGILIIGIMLGIYSISTYFEVKQLADRIDFDAIDNNLKMTAGDKYYEYLKISDYLNQKLNKNKNIPIKNTACVYLDYAQHNAIALYHLTDKTRNFEDTKKIAAAGNIRSLYNMTDNYKTCKKSALYKQELGKILNLIENTNKHDSVSEQRINEIINEYKQQKQSEYYNNVEQEVPDTYNYREQIPQPDIQEYPAENSYNE